MNAQFFFSSYVTCHATSWTRTPSGGGSRGTKDKLQRLRQITPCLSPCTDPATILGLQPRDNAAMLGIKTKEYFLEEFT